jgi:hypothetical protein
MDIIRNLLTTFILITLTVGFISTEAAAQNLKAGPPTLVSVNVAGSYIALSWTQENAIPEGGYDIFVDGKDTNRRNRTTATTAFIGGLDLTQSHCFKVESRYTKTRKFYSSNQLCSEAQPGSQTQAGPPTLVSVDTVGSDIVLSWAMENATPEGGYDIFVNGKDTNRRNRTTATTASIGGLDLTRSHCFKVESRYTKTRKFYPSNQLCSEVPTANQAPSISGNPATQVTEGSAYSFTPNASDSDGDKLSFSINNPPTWATFDTTSGTLTGTPTSSDVGLHSNIVISVSDGTDTASLATFNINVDALQLGGSFGFSKTTASVDEGGTINVTITRSNDADEASIKCGTHGVTAVSSTRDGDDYAGFSPTAVNFAKGETSKVVSVKTLDNTKVESTETFEIFLQSPSTGYELDTNTVVAVSIVDDDVEPNQAPVISGTPPGTVKVDDSYSFTPTASDVEGDSLRFSIKNKPTWASFDQQTGKLSGTPETVDIGTYSDIGITVSDVSDSSTLTAFTIVVENASTVGSITLSWTPPSTREDGTSLSLSEIDGYHIYRGDSEASLELVMDINDSSVTEYTLTNIPTGTYYFSVTTYDLDGNESGFSNTIQKQTQ